MIGVITSPYGPRFGKFHKGTDANFPMAAVPMFEIPLRALFTTNGEPWVRDPKGALDLQGNPYPDYIVGYEGSTYYWTFNHLQREGLPRSLQEIRTRKYTARHVVADPVFGTHTHIGCFKKLGVFRSISQAERDGWAIDPVKSGFWPMEGGVPMVDTALQSFKDCFWAWDGRLPEEFEIQEWRASGLDAPVYVRERRILPGVGARDNQIKKQNDQLGEALTLLRERTKEVEDLKLIIANGGIVNTESIRMHAEAITKEVS